MNKREKQLEEYRETLTSTLVRAAANEDGEKLIASCTAMIYSLDYSELAFLKSQLRKYKVVNGMMMLTIAAFGLAKKNGTLDEYRPKRAKRRRITSERIAEDFRNMTPERRAALREKYGLPAETE